MPPAFIRIRTLKPWHLIETRRLLETRCLGTTLQMDRQTDNLLWHHHAVKIGRQNIADIIGIADTLS